MLATTCPVCQTIELEDKQGQKYCVACQEVKLFNGLTLQHIGLEEMVLKIYLLFQTFSPIKGHVIEIENFL